MARGRGAWRAAAISVESNRQKSVTITAASSLDAGRCCSGRVLPWRMTGLLWAASTGANLDIPCGPIRPHSASTSTLIQKDLEVAPPRASVDVGTESPAAVVLSRSLASSSDLLLGQRNRRGYWKLGRKTARGVSGPRDVRVLDCRGVYYILQPGVRGVDVYECLSSPLRASAPEMTAPVELYMCACACSGYPISPNPWPLLWPCETVIATMQHRGFASDGFFHGKGRMLVLLVVYSRGLAPTPLPRILIDLVHGDILLANHSSLAHTHTPVD